MCGLRGTESLPAIKLGEGSCQLVISPFKCLPGEKKSGILLDRTDLIFYLVKLLIIFSIHEINYTGQVYPESVPNLNRNH